MIRSPLEQAETETRAALDGLTKALDGPALAADASLVVLRVYGDALRLRLDTPVKLRRWAEACAPALLEDVLAAALSLLDPARVPPANTSGAAVDPAVRSIVLDRDHAESVLVAIRRVWLPRPMSQLRAHGPLIERLTVIDRALASVLTRAEVMEMLGQRVALGAAWTHAFRDDDEHDDSSSLPILPSLPPSPTVVARYIEGGLMRSLVERIAEATPSFAEELAVAIDAMRAAGQAGFVARRWQQMHATGAAAAAAFRFAAPPLAHAAASGNEAGPHEAHRLGKLFADVDADASLVVGDREVTLQLDFEPGAIARVAFGDEERAPREGESSCSITVPRSASPIRLEVTSTSGQLVSEALSFAPLEP